MVRPIIMFVHALIFPFRDILYELATVGDLPLPKSTPPASNKRERDADSPASATPTSSNSPSALTPDFPRNIAGSRRVTTSTQGRQYPSQQQMPQQPLQMKHEQQSILTLPVYSDELARLPLHAQNQPPMDPSQWFNPNLTPSTPSTSTGLHSQASYPQPDINMPSSFSMDSLLYEQMGLNYASPFAQTTSSASSLSQSAFLSGTPGGSMFTMGGEIDPQQMSMLPGRFPSANLNANAQALIDSDTIAMWSNAPTGFECVICLSGYRCRVANYPIPLGWTIGALISLTLAILRKDFIIPPDITLPAPSSSDSA